MALKFLQDTSFWKGKPYESSFQYKSDYNIEKSEDIEKARKKPARHVRRLRTGKIVEAGKGAKKPKPTALNAYVKGAVKDDRFELYSGEEKGFATMAIAQAVFGGAKVLSAALKGLHVKDKATVEGIVDAVGEGVAGWGEWEGKEGKFANSLKKNNVLELPDANPAQFSKVAGKALRAGKVLDKQFQTWKFLGANDTASRDNALAELGKLVGDSLGIDMEAEEEEAFFPEDVGNAVGIFGDRTFDWKQQDEAQDWMDTQTDKGITVVQFDNKDDAYWLFTLKKGTTPEKNKANWKKFIEDLPEGLRKRVKKIKILEDTTEADANEDFALRKKPIRHKRVSRLGKPYFAGTGAPKAPEVEDFKNLQVGTRIKYLGDMANPSGIGEIIDVRHSDFYNTPVYDIQLRDGRNKKGMMPTLFTGIGKRFAVIAPIPEHLQRLREQVGKVAPKYGLKEIAITRNEGPNELVGIPHTFTTFKDANAFLVESAATAPEMGYDKHKFKVTWDNGEIYEGRLDVQPVSKPDNDTDLPKHIRDFAGAVVFGPEWATEEDREKMKRFSRENFGDEGVAFFTQILEGDYATTDFEPVVEGEVWAGIEREGERVKKLRDKYKDVPLTIDPGTGETVIKPPTQVREELKEELARLNKEHDEIIHSRIPNRNKLLTEMVEKKAKIAKKIYPVNVTVQEQRNLYGTPTGKSYGQIDFTRAHNGWFDATIFHKDVRGRTVPNDLGEKIGVYFSEMGGSGTVRFEPTPENIEIVNDALGGAGYMTSPEENEDFEKAFGKRVSRKKPKRHVRTRGGKPYYAGRGFRPPAIADFAEIVEEFKAEYQDPSEFTVDNLIEFMDREYSDVPQETKNQAIRDIEREEIPERETDDFAARKKPRGHKGYQRVTPTGKIAQIKEKPYAKEPKKGAIPTSKNLVNWDVSTWKRLDVSSGSQLHANKELQRQYLSAVKSKWGNLKGKLSKKHYEKLEDQNAHTLNEALAILGMYDESVPADWKKPYRFKHVFEGKDIDTEQGGGSPIESAKKDIEEAKRLKEKAPLEAEWDSGVKTKADYDKYISEVQTWIDEKEGKKSQEDFAGRKKPRGHKGYTRMTPSGKIAQIKEKPYAKDPKEVGQPKARTLTWLETTLRNDDASSDEELKQHFIENGLSEIQADEVLSHRDAALKGEPFEIDLEVGEAPDIDTETQQIIDIEEEIYGKDRMAEREPEDFTARKKPVRHARMSPTGKPYFAGTGAPIKQVGDSAIYKRTFEARKYPKGSPERKKLNDDSVTSEYMTSYKYAVKTPVSSTSHRTLDEAEGFVERTFDKSAGPNVKIIGKSIFTKARKKPARHVRRLRTGKIVEAGRGAPKPKEIPTEEAPAVSGLKVDVKKLKDKDSYQKTYYRIDAGYKWGSGMEKEEYAKFHTDVKKFLKNNGFKVNKPKFSSSSYTGTRDGESLYMHPQGFSGFIKKKNIKALEKDLKSGDYPNFSLRGIDTYDEAYNMTEAELGSILEDNKESVGNMILDEFKTPKRNLYKSNSMSILNGLSRTAQKDLKVMDDLERKNKVESYVRNAFMELVKDGKITEVQDPRRGAMYRTKEEGKGAKPAVGKKRFKVQHNIGSAKYVVSFHDGVKKHPDGSDFYDIRIFKNKKGLEQAINELNKKGYTEEGIAEGERQEVELPPVKEWEGNMVRIKHNTDPEFKDNPWWVEMAPAYADDHMPDDDEFSPTGGSVGYSDSTFKTYEEAMEFFNDLDKGSEFMAKKYPDLAEWE